jgi:hypothetical protein
VLGNGLLELGGLGSLLLTNLDDHLPKIQTKPSNQQNQRVQGQSSAAKGSYCRFKWAATLLVSFCSTLLESKHQTSSIPFIRC